MNPLYTATNFQIKPDSFITPSLIKGIFKTFVPRAKKLCFEKYIEDEMSSVIDMYVENRLGQNCLNSAVKENKNQAPKTANTGKKDPQTTMDINYRIQNKKIT